MTLPQFVLLLLPVNCCGIEALCNFLKKKPVLDTRQLWKQSISHCSTLTVRLMTQVPAHCKSKLDKQRKTYQWVDGSIRSGGIGFVHIRKLYYKGSKCLVTHKVACGNDKFLN